MTLRVLFVDHESRLSGAERNLVDLVSALEDAGVDCHAAIPPEGPLERALVAAGATVHPLRLAEGLRSVSRWELAARPWQALRHLGSVARSALSLALLARRLRPDVLHSNSQKAHVLAALAARGAGCPLVWHMEDILEPGWLRRAMSGLATVSVDRVIAISWAAAEPFTGTRAATRTRVVYPGVRVDDVTADQVRQWRSTLAGTGDSLIGIVGQIAWWKGTDVFVEAAARLAADRPGVRFAIVGKCLYPANEASFEAAVRRRATELGLDDRLTWCGHVEPVAPVMAALNVLVHASRLPEPFGRVLVEAQVQGTPVVSTTVGAGPELIGPEIGRLVPPDDPDTLARAIGELLDGRRASEPPFAAPAANIVTPAASAQAVLDVYAELVAP